MSSISSITSTPSPSSSTPSSFRGNASGARSDLIATNSCVCSASFWTSNVTSPAGAEVGSGVIEVSLGHPDGALVTSTAHRDEREQDGGRDGDRSSSEPIHALLLSGTLHVGGDPTFCGSCSASRPRARERRQLRTPTIALGPPDDSGRREPEEPADVVWENRERDSGRLRGASGRAHRRSAGRRSPPERRHHLERLGRPLVRALEVASIASASGKQCATVKRVPSSSRYIR